METKNAAELVLVSLLHEALPDLSFYPSKSEAIPKPPFGSVVIDRADKVLPREETFSLSGHLTWISRADATTAAEHANTFKRIYDALAQIEGGYDVATKLIIHGITVLSTEEFTDEARQGYGDKLFFNMGVTERYAS